MANILTDPPFAADPPIKVNVPAKTLGLIAGILGVIGILFGLLALPAIFALNNACSELNGLGITTSCNTGIFGIALIGVLVAFVGAILYAFGGFRMYQLNRSGKDLVIYGLIVSLVGGILEIVGYVHRRLRQSSRRLREPAPAPAERLTNH
ncbi:MAG: hypothetical protein ABSC35_10800 [Candidatus Dormibacteria bacterium]